MTTRAKTTIEVAEDREGPVVPYDEIDPGVRDLVRALNELPGCATTGSCEGHATPGPGAWPLGSWYVKLGFDLGGEGRFALELLAWLVNDYLVSRLPRVLFFPVAAPVDLNWPMSTLAFTLECQDNPEVDPQEVADEIRKYANHVGAQFDSSLEILALGFGE